MGANTSRSWGNVEMSSHMPLVAILLSPNLLELRRRHQERRRKYIRLGLDAITPSTIEALGARQPREPVMEKIVAQLMRHGEAVSPSRREVRNEDSEVSNVTHLKRLWPVGVLLDATKDLQEKIQVGLSGVIDLVMLTDTDCIVRD
ncbi:hypothetical protein [Janibacter sp. LM]|uniref:hypothetical protein n=1 Tax=Janibacter sp. LM TaxID=3144845 RepID=UPI0031F6FFED